MASDCDARRRHAPRSLRNHRFHRRRRHGGGLSRQGQPAQPRRRRQGTAGGHRQRRRSAGTVRARSAGSRRAFASQHSRDLRRRPRRRDRVFRFRPPARSRTGAAAAGGASSRGSIARARCSVRLGRQASTSLRRSRPTNRRWRSRAGTINPPATSGRSILHGRRCRVLRSIPRPRSTRCGRPTGRSSTSRRKTGFSRRTPTAPAPRRSCSARHRA